MPKKVLIDNITNNIEHAALTAKKALIESDMSKFAEDKITELDGWIAKLPDRKAEKGNVTMKEYLFSLKSKIQKDKIGYAQRVIARLEAEISSHGG